MKFSWKIFVSTFLIVLLSLAAGGYFLVVSAFSSGLSRETDSAREENRMLQLMLAVNLSGTEDNGIDLSLLIEDSLKNLDTRMESVLIRYRVSGSDKRTIYSNSGGLGHRIDAKRSLISKIQEGGIGHAVRRMDNTYCVQTASLLLFEGEPFMWKLFGM